MESAEDQRLLQILPPRPEDAGLEDCALPPDSILEAFLKAAAMKSRAADDERESCVEDPWPEVTVESGADDVVVVGGGEEEDGPKDCVDGLRGLEIGDDKENTNGSRDDGDEDEERHVLVEGYV